MTVGGVTVFVRTDGSFPREPGVYPTESHLAAVGSDGRAVKGSLSEAGISASGTVVRDGLVYPVVPGLVTLGEKTYLLDGDGVFAVGWHLAGGKLRRFNGDGTMVRGSDGIDTNGAFIPSETGIHTFIWASYWFLDRQGTVATGLFEDEFGVVRYADDDGHLISGIVTIGGRRYYFYDETSSFAMARNEMLFGIQDGDGKYMFHAGPDGALSVGWTVIKGDQENTETLHYFDENGHMLFDTVVDGRYINMNGEVVE